MLEKSDDLSPINIVDLEVKEQIVDDSALIDCINMLNKLRDEEFSARTLLADSNRQMDREVQIKTIEQVGAEVRWLSQWLTAKVKSAA